MFNENLSLDFLKMLTDDGWKHELEIPDLESCVYNSIYVPNTEVVINLGVPMLQISSIVGT